MKQMNYKAIITRDGKECSYVESSTMEGVIKNAKSQISCLAMVNGLRMSKSEKRKALAPFDFRASRLN